MDMQDAGISTCRTGPTGLAKGLRPLRIIRLMTSENSNLPNLHAGAQRPRVLIVDCGFGGLEAARALRRADVDITVIDRTNHHLFQPLLYQVATAGLSAPAIAAPVRHLFRNQPNVTTLMGEVTAIDTGLRQVRLADGGVLAWDHLIVAAGATHSYFGRDEWAPFAPGLKTLADAFEIRRRVLLAFEAAEREADPVRQAALMTFAVIGGGPTGVEMAGTLAEIARHTLPGEFRRIDPARARVLLIEGGARVLQSMPESLSLRACEQLQKLGVEVRTSARVTSIDAKGLDIGDIRIDSGCVVWAAGVAASPLGHQSQLGRGRPHVAARPHPLLGLLRLVVLAVCARLFSDRLSQPADRADRLGAGVLELRAQRPGGGRKRRGLNAGPRSRSRTTRRGSPALRPAHRVYAGFTAA